MRTALCWVQEARLKSSKDRVLHIHTKYPAVDEWRLRLRDDGDVGKEVTTGWSTVIFFLGGGNEMF